MGSAEEASVLGLIGLGSCLLVLGACDAPPAGERSRTREISGPVGSEHDVHPLFPTEGREALAGCCSFAVGGATVRRLEGDVDGREIRGADYRAIISFGNGLARASNPAHSPAVFRIDGVTLEKRVQRSAQASEPRFLYRAIVPLDAQARARNIRDPGLEITGWCSSPSGCDKLAEILDSIRF